VAVLVQSVGTANTLIASTRTPLVYKLPGSLALTTAVSLPVGTSLSIGRVVLTLALLARVAC